MHAERFQSSRQFLQNHKFMSTRRSNKSGCFKIHHFLRLSRITKLNAFKAARKEFSGDLNANSQIRAEFAAKVWLREINLTVVTGDNLAPCVLMKICTCETIPLFWKSRKDRNWVWENWRWKLIWQTRREHDSSETKENKPSGNTNHLSLWLAMASESERTQHVFSSLGQVVSVCFALFVISCLGKRNLPNKHTLQHVRPSYNTCDFFVGTRPKRRGSDRANKLFQSLGLSAGQVCVSFCWRQYSREHSISSQGITGYKEKQWQTHQYR